MFHRSTIGYQPSNTFSMFAKYQGDCVCVLHHHESKNSVVQVNYFAQIRMCDGWNTCTCPIILVICSHGKHKERLIYNGWIDESIKKNMVGSMNINLEGHLFLPLHKKCSCHLESIYLFLQAMKHCYFEKCFVTVFDMDTTPYLSNTPVFC